MHIKSFLITSLTQSMWVVPSVGMLTLHFWLYSLWFSNWLSIFICFNWFFFAAFKNFDRCWVIFHLATCWWKLLFFFNYWTLFLFRHYFWVRFSWYDLCWFVFWYSGWLDKHIYLVEFFLLFALQHTIDIVRILGRPYLINMF